MEISIASNTQPPQPPQPIRPLRPPLGDSTNELSTHAALSRRVGVGHAAAHKLRHQHSIRALHFNADSSESLPSSQNSIFEALCYNPSTEQVDEQLPESSFVIGGRTLLPDIDLLLLPPPRNRSQELQTRSVHYPTPLETITEQKSIATLKTQTSSLVHNQSSRATLPARRPSTKTIKNARRANRKKSFSLDDLITIRRCSRIFKDAVSSSSEQTVCCTRAESQYPVLPAQTPPTRMPTPPGIPTFNTPAAASFRFPAPSSRFRDRIRRHKTAEEREWISQTTDLPRGVMMRGEGGVLVRGRWKPGQSGHTGNPGRIGIASFFRNPLHRATVAGTACPHVTFSSLRGAQDEVMQAAHCGHPEEGQGTGRNGAHSVRHNLQDAQEQTRGSTATELHEQRSNGWSKLGQLFCYICCGAEMSDDSLSRFHVEAHSERRVQPTYYSPIVV